MKIAHYISTTTKAIPIFKEFRTSVKNTTVRLFNAAGPPQKKGIILL
jgi:hypothetical protein